MISDADAAVNHCLSVTFSGQNNCNSLAEVSVPVVWPLAAVPAGQLERCCSLVKLLPASPAGLLPAASHSPHLLPKLLLEADAHPVDVVTA